MNRFSTRPDLIIVATLSLSTLTLVAFGAVKPEKLDSKGYSQLILTLTSGLLGYVSHVATDSSIDATVELKDLDGEDEENNRDPWDNIK